MATILNSLTPDTIARTRPRACPVCGARAARLRYQNVLASFAGFDFSASIKTCECCGAAYAGEALAQSDLDRYYAELSKYDTPMTGSQMSGLDRTRAAMAVDFLKPHLSKWKSAIEIGSSVGYLLHQLQAAGLAEVCGLDPAPAAAEAGRRLFGVDIQTGHAETFSGYGRYDVVLLRAVLEHLLDPADTLLQIGQQLSLGAHLFVEVPDAGAFDRPEGGCSFEPFGEFSNEHINYFAIADLARLAAAAGMEVVSWRSIRVFDSLPGLLVLLRRTASPSDMPAADPVSAPSRPTSGLAIEAYIAASSHRFENLEDRLGHLRGREVLLYGAGNHTLRLLAGSAALRTATIRAIADRNANFHGIMVGGVPVIAPSALAGFPDLPIIISSFNARQEIEAALRQMTSQTIIQLYD